MSSHLNPPQNGVKSSSRFSSLNNVFKLKSGSTDGAAPPPPPKDPAYSPNTPSSAFYSKSFFSRSAASLVPSLSPESLSGPATPASPYPPIPSAGFEVGKRSNGAFQWTNGRVAAPSPAPSASGTSLRSLGRGVGDCLASPSVDGGTDSSGSCPNVNANINDIYLSHSATSSAFAVGHASSAGTKPKRGVFKLTSLAKKNKSKKDLSDTASTSRSVSRSASVSEQDSASGKTDGDEGISLPWNFQHNIHVDEGYIGLPPSWSSALSQAGFNEDEIAAIHARRRAAVIATPPNIKPPNSHTANAIELSASPHGSTVTLPATSPSAPNILLEPAPRSTSLRKGCDTLTVHPPSMYSVATSISGGPSGITGRSSPTPSPRAPSFSMKSLVSSIKNSLTSDSASTKEGVGSSSRSKDATGEESEQYVLINGSGPDGGEDHEDGDETATESYPFDASGVSSHQIHASRTRRLSQGQQTPRMPTFPQIQVHDAGHFSSPSTSRAPSPLAHLTSLPLSTPPLGHTYSNQSASSSPHSLASAGPRPGSASAPPRTPPKRIYHVANPSSDSYEGKNYLEPPPAYVWPNKEVSTTRKEKEGFGVSGGPPLPNRPIPPVPTEEAVGESSGLSNHNSREEDQEVSTPDSTGLLAEDFPGTADEVLDISTRDSDISTSGEGVPAQQVRLSSPTPQLAIDERIAKLVTLPPRISLLQEGSLEDWSESLFREIGGKGKRSSILAGPNDDVAASVKKERRTTIRQMSRLSMITGDPAATTSNSLQSDTVVPPSLPGISFEANLALEPHAKGTIDPVEEGDEQEQADVVPEGDAEETAEDADITAEAEAEEAKEEIEGVGGSPVTSPTPVLPDASLGPNVSSLGKDPPLPASPPSSPESPRRASVDSIPPSPPPKPKPKPKPTPLVLPVLPFPVTLAPPRTNIITGISGRSPVNSLFGAKPQPLPVPIPPAQIRAQLRPPPPRPPHPPPTLPLPPLKRFPSQPNLPLPSPAQSPPPPIPPSQRTLKHDLTASQASSLMGSRPNSSQTLLPTHGNGDRDSGLSTITVTPATIATAKAEVVRTAVASVIDSEAVSLASRQESVVSAADAEPQTLTLDTGEVSPRTQELPDDSLVSETPSVSLLRADSQTKWPTPPPPPVELETDTTSRRLSRFRTTSLGRVTHLQAMGSQATSPSSSHCSHWSSETTSSSTSESAPLTTPKGISGVSSSIAPKANGFLAAEARLLSSTMDTFGGVQVESESGKEGEACSLLSETLPEPHTSTVPYTHPLLAQLQPYISHCNPASSFTNLVEIAEGESGSVFAARVASFSHGGQQDNPERPIPPGASHVAIKRVPLPPAASSPSLSDDSPATNKLVSVLHELSLLKNLDHEHLLLLDGIYVCLDSTDAEPANAVDTSIWIRMELMERSLADVIGLVAEGLALQERLIARFASDILHGLDYLQRQHIAHRDVRSDNLLVNASGVVKIADFSNAIRVDRNAPTVMGVVGVIYWQAPEMRAGPYNALKVDIWSLGATVWELAETTPPFSTPASPSTQMSFAIQATRKIGLQWPPLSHPEHYSRTFHEFLRLCGRESAGRPSPGELLNTAFIRNACGRPVILQLLSQCRSIEEAIAAKEASASQS